MAKQEIFFTAGSEVANNSSDIAWTNPSNAYDNDLDTSASVTLAQDQVSKELKGTTNNNSISSGTIVQVVAGYYGPTSSGISGSYGYLKVYLNGTYHSTEDISYGAGKYYVDITDKKTSWSWDDINNLDIGLYLENISPFTQTFYVRDLFIGVTYTTKNTIETVTISYTSGSEGSGGVSWSNPSYAWDKNDSNRASVTLSGWPNNQSNPLTATGHDNSHSTEEVLTVKMGVKHYGTDLSGITLYPIFGGSIQGDSYDLTVLNTEQTDWADITWDKESPSNWTWSDVNNLDIKLDCFSFQSLTYYLNQFYLEVEYAYDSTGVDLTVSELNHSHSLEQSSLTQNHSLTTSELNHSHSLEQSSLTQNHDISISELGHNHSLEQSSLSQNHNITVSELSHNHSLEQSTLTQTHSLTVSELSHDHTLEQTEIGQIHALNIDKLNHEHLLDETTLTQIYVLNVDSLEHQHLLDTVSLGNFLDVSSLLHSHLLDESTLSQIHHLTVESLEHAQNLDQTSLSQIHNLSVVALNHGHIIDVVQLGQIHDLSVLDLHHNHSVEKVTVGQIHNLQVEKLEHQQLLDELSIGQIHNLSVSELEHSHIVTVPQISQIHSLQLLSLEHNHILDENTIIQVHKLQVQGLRSEQIIDDSQIGQIHNLNIKSLDHEHTLDIVTIDQLIILIAERLVHQHLLDKGSLVIPFRCIKIRPLQTTFDLKSGWSRTYQIRVYPLTFNFTVKEETYDRS